MTRGSGREYPDKSGRGRYLLASKKEKGRLPDEFTQVTGYHPDLSGQQSACSVEASHPG